MLLDASLTVLEQLKAINLAASPRPTTENIYQSGTSRRIPSIYATTRASFDALGPQLPGGEPGATAARRLVSEASSCTSARTPCVACHALLAHRARARRRRRRLARARRQPDSYEAIFALRNFTFASTRTCSSSSCARPPSTPHLVLRHERCARGARQRPRQWSAPPSWNGRRELVLREVSCPARPAALERYGRRPTRKLHLHGRLDIAALTRMLKYAPSDSCRRSTGTRPARTPDHARSGAWPQQMTATSTRCPRLRPQHRALRRHAGHVVPAHLRHTIRRRGGGGVARASDRAAAGRPAPRCCSPSAPAPPSPCRAS